MPKERLDVRNCLTSEDWKLLRRPPALFFAQPLVLWEKTISDQEDSARTWVMDVRERERETAVVNEAGNFEIERPVGRTDKR